MQLHWEVLEAITEHINLGDKHHTAEAKDKYGISGVVRSEAALSVGRRGRHQLGGRAGG
jgi:hypothetical protein